MVVRTLSVETYANTAVVKRKLRALRTRITSSNKKSLAELANFVRDKAIFFAPKGVTSPGLKKSIYVEEGANNNEKFIVAYGRQARPMEYGFKKHAVSLTKHPEMREWVYSKYGTPYNNVFWVGGGPSGDGYHYMRKAWSEASNDAQLNRLFGDKIRQAIKPR